MIFRLKAFIFILILTKIIAANDFENVVDCYAKALQTLQKTREELKFY